MGIYDRDYMREHRPRAVSSHSGRHKAPILARLRFAVWLLFRRLFGKR